MKLGTLLIVASLLIGSAAYGQMTDCEKNLGVANNGYAAGNFPEAIEYYKKVEAECDPGLGKDDYNRLVASYFALMEEQEDGSDTWLDLLEKVMNNWELMDEKKFYDSSDDVSRGYYYTRLREPNYQKADEFLRKGIRAEGTDLYDENFITLFYFNTYTLWYIELDEAKKGEYKQLLIKDYFEMSKLIKDANFAPSIQEGLTGYLGQVLTSCDDLTPEIPVFIESLPEDPESKLSALLSMGDLMEQQGCTKEEEYKDLVRLMYEIAPQNSDVILKYISTAGSSSEKIAAYKKLLEDATEDEVKYKYRYSIAYEFYNSGQYKVAYGKAAGIGGSYKTKALEIRANAVAQTANSCGVSTFERKCNYIYAAQLMEQAGKTSAAEKYRAAGPTDSEKFDNGSPSSVTLECWGVTVNL